MTLLLASASPQRALLLAQAGVPHTVVPTACDEQAITGDLAQVLAIERARGKAKGADTTAYRAQQPCVVLGADTVVALGRELIGKPRDREDARGILARLQGTTHSVITGHCCLTIGDDGAVLAEACGLAIAHVTMRSMNAADIAAYVASGESDNRAGAYAIQETADRFVVDVQGSFSTVVGLHVPTVARLYRECTDRELPGFSPDFGSGGYRIRP